MMSTALKKAAIALFRGYPTAIRNRFYELVGIKLNGAEVRYNVFISNPDLLRIGDDCFINANVSFHFGASNVTIELGDGVYVGPNTLFTTVTHEIGSSSKRAGVNRYSPIRVGDGVWIGASCTILPGVTIGEGSVVAAGALVNKDVPANTLVGGVPAKVIRDLP